MTGQGVRWAGMRTANRVRSPQRAAAAQSERTAALVNQLVRQLGQMRGAAMEVGQVLSMVEFDGLPEDQRDALQAKLAELRDDVPPVSFSKLERLMGEEFGGPLSRIFSEFDEHAFAAASIGQVHRATTLDGDDVVVKVQYPGVAEAVETDLRNAMLLWPLVKRLAPASTRRPSPWSCASGSSRSSTTSWRRRTSGGSSGCAAATRSSPCPPSRPSSRRAGCLCPSTSREYGSRRFARLDEPQRDSYGEIVFRFYFGLLYRERIALGDPHPGNYLLRPDGRVGFLDYGLLRDVSTARADAERGIARAVRAGDAAALKSALLAGAYLPSDGAELVDDELALELIRGATRWYAVPGERRFSGEQGHRSREPRPVDDERQVEVKDQVSQFTLPAEAILIRRMHAIVGVVLGQLRAGADWGAIAAEYLHGEPATTPLGEAESEYFTRHGRPLP